MSTAPANAPDCIIAPLPPSDGREWDGQCARCGSSVDSVECEVCGGDGVHGHDCGEDCCACLHPEENATCYLCDGAGRWYRCLSDATWCAAHPGAGREQVASGTVEWFVVVR